MTAFRRSLAAEARFGTAGRRRHDALRRAVRHGRAARRHGAAVGPGRAPDDGRAGRGTVDARGSEGDHGQLHGVLRPVHADTVRDDPLRRTRSARCSSERCSTCSPMRRSRCCRGRRSSSARCTPRDSRSRWYRPRRAPIVDLVLAALDRRGVPAFPVTIAGDEVDRTKPDPLPYLTAAERLGIDINACGRHRGLGQRRARGPGLRRDGRGRPARRADRTRGSAVHPEALWQGSAWRSCGPS